MPSRPVCAPQAALSALAALALLALSPAAQAQTAVRQCFLAGDVANYAQADSRTVYVRARFNEVFELTLQQDCSGINSQKAVAFQSFGPSVCKGVDLTLLMRDGIMERRCDVKTVRRLSPAEVSALPRGVRP